MTEPLLLDDGERMIPEFHKGQMIYGEHIARYEAAKTIVKDKTVLDIACGTGYGSKLLATTAKKVYAVDVNQLSIDYAKKHYKSRNVDYQLGDAEKIPLNDGSVEAVISFETVEHLAHYEKFINEIKRVLKPGGILMISTPNDEAYIESNRFHLHEFTYDEFKKLLGEYFKNVDSYFQSTWLFNSLVEENKLSKEWTDKIKTLVTLPINPKEAIYFVMLCSDKKPPHIEALGAISEPWSARETREAQQREKSLTDKVEDLENKIKYIDQELNGIKSSAVYRVLKKLIRK